MTQQPMSIQGERILLRAYLQTADRAPLTPTYERLLHAARREGLAGATMLKGILGLGAHGIIRRSVWSLAEHLPVIVEIVDSAERIVPFVENSLGGVLSHGLVTLERASVMLYRHRHDNPPNRLSLAALLTPLSTVPKIQASEHMEINENGVLVRIFIGESDRHQGRKLYEVIIEQARTLGLAGATVLRGSAGFGANSVMHAAKLLEMSTDLPIVIEIVDVEEKIKLLLPSLETLVQEGLVTMEYVVILMYRHDARAASSP